MAGSTNFPTSADTWASASPTNLGDADTQGRKHASRHDDMEAAMAAVQGYLRPYAFGATGYRNAIINGTMAVNQRAYSSGTTSAFGPDRWAAGITASTGSVTYSVQSFDSGTTLGSTVPAFQPRQYARLVSTGQTGAGDLAYLLQNIEDVRTLAGEVVTVSFYARAGSGTPKVAIELSQYFGSGGSPSSSVSTPAGQVTLSTTWTRYSVTATVPSVAAKVLGTGANDALGLILWASAGSTYNARTGSLGIQSATIDIWGAQVERGAVASPLELRPAQTELALCQRYYYRVALPTASTIYGMGQALTTTTGYAVIPFPMPMRGVPSALEATVTASDYRAWLPNGTSQACTSAPTHSAATTAANGVIGWTSTTAGFTAGHASAFGSGSSASYLGWSAEL